jgi:predicted amidohydrolase YtcJ
VIRTGFDADLAILADDPTSVETHRIADIAVLGTLLGGAVTHDATGLLAGLRESGDDSQ